MKIFFAIEGYSFSRAGRYKRYRPIRIDAAAAEQTT